MGDFLEALLVLLTILVVAAGALYAALRVFGAAICDLPVVGVILCAGGMEGAKCSKPSGTIWPFSGCDVSAGICCDGKCSTSC